MADGWLTTLDAAAAVRKVDGENVGPDSDEFRQSVLVGDPSTEDLAAVVDAPPAADAFGLVVRLAGPAVAPLGPSTGTATSVASSATTVSLLAANAARRGVTVRNDSTSVCYLALAATSSLTTANVKMAAGSYYEVPFGYLGPVSALWASADGYARIWEGAA